MNKTQKDLLELWHKKPAFGSLYKTGGSKYIYISINYFKHRVRFPTDKEDTPENWAYLCDFLESVGGKIKNRTFCFAKTFYWLDEDIKRKFTALEGRDYLPEPEHVLFEQYAEQWMQKKAVSFTPTQRQDFRRNLSRIVPYFKEIPFSRITTSLLEAFVDTYRQNAALDISSKRIKNLLIPMRRVWQAACNDYNWTLANPFPGLKEKYRQIDDEALENRERVLLEGPDTAPDESLRSIFLLSEWLKLQQVIDPHYHIVVELLLRGMIGSELEGLLKRNIKADEILVRHKITHETVVAESLIAGKVVKESVEKIHFGLKLKNWYRKREIPMTSKLKAMLEEAMNRSTKKDIRCFAKGIELSADEFVLTMADGSPFDYPKFYWYIWRPAFAKAGVQYRVPYAARHTLVQWALLLGVTKTRLVEIMGHCNKRMIDEVYGHYRKGLVNEREDILDYLGEDFLELEELKVGFPERYKARLAKSALKKEKALGIDATFSQSFSQSQELYPDNYHK